MSKLSSLTIFFPFFNDEGTVMRAIKDAYKYGSKVTRDLEVIAIHGGDSRDNTHDKILQLKKEWPNLKIIDKRDNDEGYAVIKYGFQKATKEWIFYTDGDLQYHLNDLEKLVQAQKKTKADVVNGFRKSRADSRLRVLFGNLYKYFSKYIFHLPVSDLTCDFRLIRRKFLNRIILKSRDSSILLELIKRLQRRRAKFAQVQVKHYPRTYGASTYTLPSLLKEKLLGDLRVGVWFITDRTKSDTKKRIQPRQKVHF